jgi:hypothetical protein
VNERLNQESRPCISALRFCAHNIADGPNARPLVDICQGVLLDDPARTFRLKLAAPLTFLVLMTSACPFDFEATHGAFSYNLPVKACS